MFNSTHEIAWNAPQGIARKRENSTDRRDATAPRIPLGRCPAAILRARGFQTEASFANNSYRGKVRRRISDDHLLIARRRRCLWRGTAILLLNPASEKSAM